MSEEKLEYPSILELEELSFYILPKAKIVHKNFDLSAVQKVIGMALKGDTASYEWMSLHVSKDHKVMKYIESVIDSRKE